MGKVSNNYDNYTDIHIHIIPGVDDGAVDPDMSVDMLAYAYAQGIRRMIVTPHNKPMHRSAGKEKILRSIEMLQARMKQENIEIELYPGSELYYREELVRCLEQGEAVTMADSRYVLIEFMPADGWEYIRDGINSILMAGYRPIVAHVERYQEICKNMERAVRLREMGCCIQVNAAGVMGRYGMETKRYVRKLMKQRLVDFIATDAHNAADRAPDLADCAAYIGRKYGEDYMRRLLVENPSKVIGDEYI